MNEYKNEDALVLFSGGQDSTTCLFWAKQNFRNVHTLCFSYGQRHSQEVKNAERIASMANVSFQVLDATIISHLAPNSLTDSSMMMDEEKPADSYPNTFVPGRNMLFLTFAATIAYAQNIRHLVTGVSEADYSGYPDCRDTFIKSANATLNLAMDRQFLIHTPLMWRNKKQVWQLADELGVFDLVRNETLTCYNGIIADGCGHCPACKLRNKGLQEYLAERK
ncbi:MAG TPA: 7-cyano-7-deazaguanine synthase QueC [Dysgonamonadaceae bacterium]|jgi:7-cyano-7-deazaguanine synthase|uniref:7-cyano-7-deazaguanine synthase QueC n=1 Tax=Seramator thermalis TaxID=2496270 RepID=UPI0009D3164B|nr:7-cyano-7-deazaguanine synthase QueC [Seramator thermalis]MDI3505633.1 7-cyano-7-deazaguanine synthase [Bacteroidota bacterium]OPZ12593.1 MAG: 7-cyano-7-deazaguanine synthase [Bacteroidetes bacterium ADurb.BinA261]HOM64107.1 7-cyano-7-deazaguanine synthase QueC [Dysgonamonadaceae bacterium]MDK2969962.1 7-cyano-7-deazaguanine synthase [Bacteroidota bacterium]MDN5306186.1 7-cyano-7-deazaguanine synthase [Bacteroidota bacterium]